MYDVNPLGPLMHLKELERQAISASHRDRDGSRSNISALREGLAILLRRLLSARNGVVRHKEINSPLR
jgi:hypothetical protein